METVGELIAEINPILRGWMNYFACGHSSRRFSYIRDWVEKKVQRRLARACQHKGFGWKRWSKEWLYETLGLFNEYRVSHRLWFAKTPADRHSNLRSCRAHRADSLCRQNPTARQVLRRPNPRVRVGCVCSMVWECWDLQCGSNGSAEQELYGCSSGLMELRCAPLVAMVKAADFGKLDHRSPIWRLHRAGLRRVLVQ